MDQKRKWQRSTRTLALAVNIVLAMALVLAIFAHTQPALAVECKFKHKVVAGDTLIGIGQLYSYDWREIAEASDLKEPYVLTVGQVLCIPGGTKPADTTTTTTTADDGTSTTTTTKKSPTLTTGASINSVYVKVEAFPKYTVYFVRVQSTPNAEGIKIGRLRTDKNGNFEDWFRIPAGVTQTENMVVCLKNAWTDKLSCIGYENPYYVYTPTNSSCYKVAR